MTAADGGGVGDAFACNMLFVAASAMAANANGFQPVRIE
jgi:hypothetical protein